MPLTSRALGAVLAALLIAVPAAAADTQDLRSPDARDAALVTTRQDLRSPDARDAAAQAEDPTSTSVYVSPAAAFTDTVAPAYGSATPPRSVSSNSSAGVDWTSIAFALAGALLVIGAAAAITTRRRARAAT
jgi:hypothetical protein